MARGEEERLENKASAIYTLRRAVSCCVLLQQPGERRWVCSCSNFTGGAEVDMAFSPTCALIFTGALAFVILDAAAKLSVVRDSGTIAAEATSSAAVSAKSSSPRRP